MHRCTWDSTSADSSLHCSKLVLEGANIFPSALESFRAQGLQRQPLQKHNLVRSHEDTTAKHSIANVKGHSGLALKTAVWDTTSRCSASAVGCGRPSSECQPLTPGRLGSPHIASWHKQRIHAATSLPVADGSRTLEELPAPSGPSSSRMSEPAAESRSLSDSTARRPPSGLAVRIVPQDRRARWDSQKRLAFTPPASLSSDSRSRRASLGLPGGPRKQSSPDDAAVRLPPLTPPGMETTSQPAADAAAVAAAAAAASIRLTSACGASGRAACHVMKAGIDSNSWLASASCKGDHSPGQAIAAVQTEAQPAHSTLGEAGRQDPTAPATSPSPIADHAAYLGVSQSEPGVKLLQQQLQQQQTQSVLQSQLLAAAAATDTGQIGPPITRMRPRAVPSSPAAARKGGNKEPNVAGGLHSAAEAILLDALLCGWEQHNNDGELYPLTIALEKEGGEGANLQKLQLATAVQLDRRVTGPPLPQGSPSRTKPGKPPPRRRWQQE